MQHLSRSVGYVAGAAIVALVAAGCGSSSDDTATTSGGDGAKKVTITSPEDGASVKQPFMIKWTSSEKLGPPDTGRDHVHVFVDGKSNDYTVVGGNSFQLKGLSPGQHELDVTLQHADHSSDGAGDKIMVTVSGGGGGGQSSSSDDGGGYKY
jgi:hypothetical protein